MKDFIGQEDRTEWIPVSECRDGWLYYVHARNSNAGIYCLAEKGFVISRLKFSDNFLFTEYHWDTGEPYGTVKPLREIKKAPKFKDDDEKLAWLNVERKLLPDPWKP